MHKNNWIHRASFTGLTVLLAMLISACASDYDSRDQHVGHDDHESSEPATDLGHDGHEGHEEDEGHDEHEGEGVVHLDTETLDEFGVTKAKAGPDSLHREIRLPGEVRLDQDRMAHVTPTVPGNVHQVLVKEGEYVQRGQVLAVLHSEQLAAAKSSYLESREQLRLARASHQRIQTLRGDGIASKEELQVAQRDLQSAEISLQSAEQTLHALGIHDDRIERIGGDPSVELSHHELLAPLTGRVIQRRIVQGERVSEETDAFIVADLSTVWVDANVYPRDLGIIREGMAVNVIAGYGIPTVSGTISYVGPLVGERTRTAIARSEVSNPDGLLRPGLFVTVKVATESFPVEIAVPRTALVQLEGKPHLFVQEGEEFHAVEVVIGMENDTRVEIVEGLEPGQIYISSNGFILKAEMEKGSFGDGHAH